MSIFAPNAVQKNPMCPEIKQQWIAALRSGQYHQGAGCLNQTEADGQDTMCCLGVLCDIYHRTTGLGKWHSINPDQRSFTVPGGYTSATYLPKPVKDWAGLSSSNPAIPFSGEENKISSAIALNDTYGLSFNEIADLIEAGL